MINIHTCMKLTMMFATSSEVQHHKNRALLPAPPACGRTIPISSRIMGGSISQIREFPWMVAITIPRKSHPNPTKFYILYPYLSRTVILKHL